MKILIVDDSIFAQKNIIRLLSEEFKETDIVTADDGIEGFELCKKLKPEYVFIDLLMPNMNGKELILALKANNIESKIIVVSADVQNEVKKELEDIGIFKFINKPFNKEKAKELAQSIKGEMGA